MALDNYANLKKSIINWSHRRDVDTQIDDFISLAETEMFNNDEEILMLDDLEQKATLTTTGQSIELPSGFIELTSAKIITGGKDHKLKYKTPDELHVFSDQGLPSFYTIIGNQIFFDVVPDSGYDLELVYKSEVVPLDATNDVNAVLTDNPNIYLFGALWALKEWAEEPEDAQKYYVRFIKAIRGANKRYRKGKYGASLQMRPAGFRGDGGNKYGT